MKKLFIIYFICLGCLFSCGQTDQFSIEGTVEGKQDGKVFLVGYNESPDTLGWANIQDGKFVLKGKVNESTEALLYIFNEERVYSVILLENANYKAYINVKTDSKPSYRNSFTGYSLRLQCHWKRRR